MRWAGFTSLHFPCFEIKAGARGGGRTHTHHVSQIPRSYQQQQRSGGATGRCSCVLHTGARSATHQKAHTHADLSGSRGALVTSHSKHNAGRNNGSPTLRMLLHIPNPPRSLPRKKKVNFAGANPKFTTVFVNLAQRNRRTHQNQSQGTPRPPSPPPPAASARTGSPGCIPS